MKKFLLISIVAACSALVACGTEVPQDVIDTNQGIARQNAQKNADSFLPVIYPPGTTDVKLGAPIRILMDSDSTISKTCRYGDGWASGYINFDSGKKLKVYCQTAGSGKGVNGCLAESDFVTKPYKDQNGNCDADITKMEKR